MEPSFTQTQMAIAFAIVKAAPEGMPMREFGARLHTSIGQSSPTISNEPERRLDTGEYWRGMFESQKQELEEFRDRASLEAEKQRIAKCVERGASERNDSSSRRRCSGLDELEGWIENEEGPGPVDLISDDCLRLSSYAFRISKNRCALGITIKNRSMPDHIDTLYNSTCELLQLLKDAMLNSLKHVSNVKDDRDSRVVLLLLNMLHQITLGFIASFEALNELTTTIIGRKKCSRLPNELVAVFKSALDHLHSVSTLQAARENTDAENVRRRSKRARTESHEYAVSKYLSKTLVQMCQLDWKIGIVYHNEVLQGILCTVLQNTSHLLSLVVFHEHVAKSNREGNISMANSPPSTEATKFEFRYIVPILHAALGGNSKKDLVTQIIAQSSCADPNGNMVSMAKRKILEELTKSALGADLEGLKFPAEPKDLEVYSPNFVDVEPFKSDWFLECLCDLVGWDLAVEI